MWHDLVVGAHDAGGAPLSRPKELLMIPDRRGITLALIVLSALGATWPAWAADGTALDVKATGQKTFYIDGRAGSNQVSILSQSTLEDFTVVCNKVTGTCDVDPKNIEVLPRPVCDPRRGHAHRH